MSLRGTAVRFVQTQASVRGLRGNSSAWLGVWVALTGLRLLRRLATEQPVVVRERLEPGQRLVVVHRRETRRQLSRRR